MFSPITEVITELAEVRECPSLSSLFLEGSHCSYLVLQENTEHNPLFKPLYSTADSVQDRHALEISIAPLRSVIYGIWALCHQKTIITIIMLMMVKNLQRFYFYSEDFRVFL